jgi:hypothetical protein
MDISAKLKRVNERLRKAKVKVSVEQIGDSLILRATLPPKPNSTKLKPFQQRVPTKLPATLAGLREAENRAKLLGAQKLNKEFDWKNWGYQERGENQTCGDAVAAFEEHYLKAEGGTETTWQRDYLKVYKKLPSDAVLTPDLLEEIVKLTKANTRSRLRAATAATALAKYVGK